MSRRVLLISSSRLHGQTYMHYCQQDLYDYWGDVRELLFVPYALQNHDLYAERVRAGLEPMGFKIQAIHETSDPIAAVQKAKGIFIGGGNTFLLTRTLYETGIMPLIRERVMAGDLPYMGSSAGSNVACPTMKTTNDMPIVFPPSFDTLNLVPFQINAHYFDPDPDSTHMGETRADRLREFHEWNTTPVIGLREGGLIEVIGNQATLKGVCGAKLFQAGLVPQEFEPVCDVSFLLD